jgi:hypothetical protein
VYHRLAPRRLLAPLQYLGAFAGLVVVLGTTLALTLQLAAGVQSSQVVAKRPVPAVSHKAAVPAVVEPPALAPVQTVAQEPEPAEHAATVGQSPHQDAPVARSHGPKPRGLSPRTRAEMRPHFRDTPAREPRTLGLGLAPGTKSYTGAGGGFDAVH